MSNTTCGSGRRRRRRRRRSGRLSPGRNATLASAHPLSFLLSLHFSLLFFLLLIVVVVVVVVVAASAADDVSFVV